MGAKVLVQFLIIFLGFIFCSGTQVRLPFDGWHTGLSSSLDDPLQFHKQNEDRVGRKLVGLSKENPPNKGFEQKELKREEEQLFRYAHREAIENKFVSMKDHLQELDVVNPTATVPVINPTDPTNPTTTPITNPITTPTSPTTPTTNPITTPTTPTIAPPTTSDQSWCVASPTASETALQVALDYACGYGGTDCSAIQQGGSCFNPDTVRDHASYAFNNYYQKNPIPTSCDFGGTAVITNTDPSTSACIYPSSSTSSSVLNTTNPTGSTVFGLEPPSSSDAYSSISLGLLIFFPLISSLLSPIAGDCL